MSIVSATASKPTLPIRRPTPRKPRKPAARGVQVLEPPTPDTDGWFAIRLTVGTQAVAYLLRPIACEIGGTAFEVEKLDAQLATVETYHVRIGAPRDCSCDCKGFTFCGHCKHVESLLALDQAGRLPNGGHRSASQLAKHDPEAFAEHMNAVAADPWACPEADDVYGLPDDGSDLPMVGGDYADEPPQLDESCYFDPADLA